MSSLKIFSQSSTRQSARKSPQWQPIFTASLLQQALQMSVQTTLLAGTVLTAPALAETARREPTVLASHIQQPASAATKAPTKTKASQQKTSTRLEKLVVSGTANTPLQLQQVSVTASRLGLTALQTPASTDTQQEQQWQRRGDVTVRDIVSRSTGISDISNLGSGNAFSARGFTGNNSVAQAEDGIRLQTAASTLTFPGDSWGYQKVEVLRGPASVLYGDGSVGGLINSIRKAPTQQQNLEGRLLLGSDAAQQVAIGGSGGLHDKVAARVDVSARQGNGSVRQGDYQGLKLMTGLSVQASEHLQFKLTADSAYDAPTQYTGVPLRAGKLDKNLKDLNFNISDGIQRFNDERYRLHTDYQTDTLSLSNSLYHASSDRHWRNVEYFSFVSAKPDERQIERSGYTEIRHLQQQSGNRLQLTKPYQLGEYQAKINLGHEYTHINFRYLDNFYNGNDPTSLVSIDNFKPGLFQTLDPTVPDFTAQSRQHAVFFDHQLQLNEQFSLVQGLRLDRIKLHHQSLLGRGAFEKDYQPLAWRFGAVYQPQSQQSWYAQLSQGSDPVSSLVSLRPSNSAFRLTSARQLELGFKQQWQEQAELSAAVFRIEKDHILTRDPNDPRLRVQGGSQSSQGLEFTGRWLFSPTWHSEVNFTVLDAQYDQLLEAGGVSRAGNLPVNVPKRTANAWLYYQQNELQFSAGLKYVSARFANTGNTAKMDSYLLADASASWQLSAQSSLQLTLKNLTDKLYVPVSYDVQQVIIGPGRSIALQLDHRF